jgi:nitric-oxide synthase
MEDGTILGDPVNVEFTDLCISLGWTPKYGRWDVLPLVVMNDGGEPVWRDIPAKYAKEIKVTHPTLDWFEELDLRWFDHPPVSSFALSIGGIEYTASPFSGWYMSTEIASRDLADEYRYNALPEIARRLGLPMSNRALWKDRAVIELNTAVLYSWDKAKTTMVDHHSASDSFIAHYEKEIKTRGHCPADWVWITPPTNGAQTKVFHQEMYSYLCKPAVLTLFEKPWITYYNRLGIAPPIKKHEPVEVAQTASKDTITIAYGTETGTALQYAERLQKFLLGRRMEVSKELIELDNLDLSAIDHTLIILTSSFGDGEPPANAQEFAKIAEEAAIQASCRYAVFGLGSTLYNETFQFFPKRIDAAIKKMGGRRVIPFGGCDETRDPETAFTNWMTTLAVAIEVGTEANDATMEAEATDAALASVKSKIHHLSKFGTYAVTGGRMFFDRTNADGEYRAAYNVELSSSDGTTIEYEEGDHVSLLPPTNPDNVSLVREFVDKWGALEVEGVSVKKIISELVEFADKVEDKSVDQYLKDSEVTEDNLKEIIYTLPFKKPRHFSISSTPQYRPHTLQFAVARLENGAVSVPLTDAVKAKSSRQIQGTLRQSKFRLPADPQTGMIVVGAGTGVGPLRGMVHGRMAAPVKADVIKGPLMVIFGFRSEDEAIYSDEFDDISARGVDYHVALSRSNKGQRVTDVMMREAKKITRLLENGAHFYICGTTAMGKSVESTLATTLEKTLGLSTDESKHYMANLRKEGRLQNDTYTR